MHDHIKPITSGNYYTWGAERVIARLNELGIHVPEGAIKYPNRGSLERLSPNFTYFEHAVMDWFDDRDYDQGQALIHFRPPRNEWHVIEALDDDSPLPGDVTPGMLCPTLVDALGAVIDGCDRALVHLDKCRKDGDSVTVRIEGKEVLRIDPIQIEPFDLATRDRVRTAFKGVRQQGPEALLSFAARLPGFKDVEVEEDRHRHMNPNLGMLLGFPGNWAYAMRNALKQVGIEVKLSQAQELVAVFFGASHWHQLVKHQDEANDGLAPVAVSVKTPQGLQRRYYQTTEEAIFATGNILKNYPEPVVIETFDLSLDHHRVNIWAVKRSELQLRKNPFDYTPPCIECGGTDYWSMNEYGSTKLMKTAKRLLQRINDDHGTTVPGELLYGKGDAAAFLEEILARDGIPAEQIVYVGDSALAVYYFPEPNGSPMEVAWMRIYKFTESGFQRHEDDVAMYKAEIRLDESIDGKKLVITPDYGHGDPVTIDVGSMDQVKQLLSKTHRDDLFTLRQPQIKFSGQDFVQ